MKARTLAALVTGAAGGALIWIFGFPLWEGFLLGMSQYIGGQWVEHLYQRDRVDVEAQRILNAVREWEKRQAGWKN